MEQRKELAFDSKKKVAFIGCSKRKLPYAGKAREVYQGTLFKLNLAYCKRNFHQVYILSAKYGVLELDEVIEPYELSLNTMTVSERRQWAKKVESQIERKRITGEFWFFVGKSYFEFLKKEWIEMKTPLNKVGEIGQQLKWLTMQIKPKGFLE